MFKHCLIVFLVSMVPIIELRGAIPYGAVADVYRRHCGQYVAGAADLFFCPAHSGVGAGQARHREILHLLPGKGKKGR